MIHLMIKDTNYYINSSENIRSLINQIIEVFDDLQHIDVEDCQELILNLETFGIENHLEFLESDVKRYDIGDLTHEEFARDYCYENYSHNEILDIISTYVQWEEFYIDALSNDFDQFEFNGYVYYGKLI